MRNTHAEVDCIIRRDRKKDGPKGDTIIVVRIQGDRLLNSKPCYSCQSFMRARKIKKVIHTDKNGNFQTMRL
jgi:deoxycytidylate deaminase